MNILLQSRVTLFTVPGGDTIQVLKTKEYLEKLGVNVDISTVLEPNLSKYDLVHVFNISRPQELYLQARNAKKYNKKLLLSPIYVVYHEFDRNGREGLSKLVACFLSCDQTEYIKILMRAVKNREFHKGTMLTLASGYRSLQLKILDLTDMIVPNSQSEMLRLKKDYNLINKDFVVAPNAVDAHLFNETIDIDKGLLKFKDCVLCVARIEGRKNQLNVIRAMKALPYKLVIIGKAAPNHKSYLEKIKKEANDRTYILGSVDHSLLPQFYKVAKVHVLASWFETCGLSSLEAGVMGCNIVVSNKGDVRDYYQDYAYYCDQSSVKSIKNAIQLAHKSNVDADLRKHILHNFTWEKTAQKTLYAYEKVLRK